MTTPLEPGAVVWAEFGAGEGREQSGRRPALVISSFDHLEAATTLVTVVPCTTRDRGWANQPRLTGATGLTTETVAMTEQVRTISRDRVVAIAGHVDQACLALVLAWVGRWLA